MKRALESFLVFTRLPRLRRSASLFRQLSSGEVADDRRDFGSLAFQGEVAGIEQVDLCLRIVAFEGLGPSLQEERSFLPNTAESGGRRARKYCWNLG